MAQLDDDFPDIGVRSTSGSITYVSEDGIPEATVDAVIRTTDVARAINDWLQRVGRARGRSWDVFGRKTYQQQDNVFVQMAQCAAAVERDDILSTLADTIEGLAFQKMRFEMYDEDEQDVWNQIAADLDLDARLKEIWRELFKVSQVVIGVLWSRRTYQVRTPPVTEEDVDRLQAEIRGEDPPSRRGNRSRRRPFDIVAPEALTIIDPTKVVPVGSLMFGRERLAYIADEGEQESFEAAVNGRIGDALIPRMIEAYYEPDQGEADMLRGYDIDPTNLWLLREDAAFRHTLTKASYERFAPLRLKSVLEILDLKENLRAADRATLVGATNFIVLIKKGTDQHPAHQTEVDNLRDQATTVARIPVLVGDHRLSVEIVTPRTDNTLDDERYWTLDSRLVFRALQAFSPSALQSSQSTSNVSELSRVVSLGLESRRHQLKRTLERRLFRATVDRNEKLTEVPKLTFTPKRIALDFNQVVANTILKLRDRGDMSRATVLDEYDYDQDVEMLRRMREAKMYDPVFRSTIPHSSPQENPFREPGRPPGVVEEEPRRRNEE